MAPVGKPKTNTSRVLLALGALALSAALLALLHPTLRAQIPALSPPGPTPFTLTPPMVDQDHDGVPDSWEDDGVQITTPSGKKFLDLKGDGASSTGKDIYVWVEWMDAGDHNHKPQPAAIQGVKDAFAKKNIRLHVFVPDTGIHEINTLGTTENDDYHFDKGFDRIKQDHFPKELLGKFHFSLFAHLLGGQGTASGISRGIGAYDFIVSLAGIRINAPAGTTQDQEGTFMHELGHNLGLRHGGVGPANSGDDTTFKPNYLSVMNYAFQFFGLLYDDNQGQVFDYSEFRLDDIDESRLDRTRGLTSDPAHERFGSFFFCGCSDLLRDANPIESVSQPVDWDCSLRPAAAPPIIVSRTVRHTDTTQGCSPQPLPGEDSDWDHIQFIPAPAPGQISGMAREADRGMALSIPVVPITGVQATNTPQGVKIDWTGRHLDVVLAYRVYRIQNGAPPVKVASTDKTSAVDTTSVDGAESQYFVRALLANAAGRDPIFLAQDRLGDFRKFTAPDRGKQFAGLAGGETSEDWPVPRALLQTDPSKSVTIKAGR